MIRPPPLTLRLTAAIAVVLSGVVFFFALVGVFGPAAAVASLIVFVTLACLTFRRSQTGELPR